MSCIVIRTSQMYPTLMCRPRERSVPDTASMCEVRDQSAVRFAAMSQRSLTTTVLLFCLLCFPLLSALMRSHVELNPDGGYKNVVVAINRAIPQENCESIIKGMKLMFTSASQFLYNATDENFYFYSVHILLPESWDTQWCKQFFGQISPVNFETWDSADVLVDTSHPVYALQPWTQQSAGCGQRGDFISISGEYLANMDDFWQRFGDPGRVLVREWAKYRYGVFDEFGVPGDPLYPELYEVYSEQKYRTMKPTGCTNHPAHGTLEIITEEGNVSVFTPDACPGCNNEVTSSLLYLPVLPKLVHFCDSSSHVKEAPTKHNFLCEWRSVLDVIKSSDDVKRRSGMEPVKVENVSPKFVFIKETKQRFMFFLDRSRPMGEFEFFAFVKRAMFELFKNLPEGTQIGIVLYAETTESVLAPTRITESNRGTFFDELDKGVSIYDNRNLLEAIQKGVQLLDDQTEGVNFIIITSEAKLPPNSEEIRNLLIATRSRISFVSYTKSPNLFFKEISIETKGKYCQIQEVFSKNQGPHMKSFMSLVNVLLKFIQGRNSNEDLLYQKEHPISQSNFRPSQEMSGEFILYSRLLSATFTVFYYYGRQGFLEPNSLELISPSGTLYTNLQTYIPGIKTISIDNPQAGKWKYFFISPSGYHQSTFVQVKTRSEASVEAFSLKTWTNWDENENKINVDPLVIFLEAKKGKSALIGLLVTAKIQFTSENMLYNKEDVLNLVDDGRSDPDNQQGDGIYCNYYTNVGNHPGRYDILVSVKSAGKNSFIVAPKQNAVSWNRRCCGSVLPRSVVYESLNYFERTIIGSSFFVNEDHLSRQLVYPPGRITDLGVKPESLNHNGFTLTWTSSGRDFTVGQATSFEIRYSPSFGLLVDNFNQAMKTINTPAPKISGTKQEFSVDANLNRFQRGFLYYFGIVAYNDKTSGKISNVIHVLIPQIPTTTLQSLTTDHSVFPSSSSTSHASNDTSFSKDFKMGIPQIAGIVAGSILFIFVTLSLAIYYCAHSKRKRQKIANGLSCRKNESYDTAVEKPKHIFANGCSIYSVSSSSPLQSWTASQLLAPNSPHKSMEYKQANSPCLHKNNVDNRSDALIGKNINHMLSSLPPPDPFNLERTSLKSTSHLSSSIPSTSTEHLKSSGYNNGELEISYDDEKRIYGTPNKTVSSPCDSNYIREILTPSPVNRQIFTNTPSTEKKIRNITQV